MRSMTGYGRGEADCDGAKLSVELSTVNRKQSEIAINLPRDLTELETSIRQEINARISRGRTNVLVVLHPGGNGSRHLALDVDLARSYHRAMRSLQKKLGAPGEITIDTILQAPGVMRPPEAAIDARAAGPALERALASALTALIKMREREGKHLARDLVQRVKAIRQSLTKIRALYPDVVKKFRAALHERVAQSGLALDANDERIAREIFVFADRADISEELTRLESHLAQFSEHLQKTEPVGRALEFIVQELFREMNTLGAKANDAGIAQHVVACKTELEKIREQVQNLE
ncbi:MAG: YicC family protein [Verrucomicrobiota bacterium]|nr:YicC family protein [Verrucomicrobiota bacterium]